MDLNLEDRTMKTLTDEQAALLREHRLAIQKACGDIAALSIEISGWCPHGVVGGPKRDDECPVCRIYYAIADADTTLNDLEEDVDLYLEDGPHPGAAK